MTITALEEISLNTWPAIYQDVLDGWIVRASNGYTGRANSVHPLYPGVMPVAEKIAWCEAYYRRHGLPAKYKLTEAAQPAELDAELAARGYRREPTVSVQTAEITALHLPEAGWTKEVSLDDWLVAYSFCTGAAHDLSSTRSILARIMHPCEYVVVSGPDGPLACGLSVVERGYVGYFHIVTAQAARRRGYAGRVMAALTAWGTAHGATHTFLQVIAHNAPARALYEKLGFTEAYQYWYRVQE